MNALGSLRGQPTRSLEDKTAEHNVDNGGPAQEFSGGNNINNQARDYPGDILAKNVDAFVLILKSYLKQN